MADNLSSAWTRQMALIVSLAVLICAIFLCFSPATTEAGKGGPFKNIYPYYWKSKIRYPYYDKFGRGKLLYGYGGPELHEYSAFKPIEGYYRRK